MKILYLDCSMGVAGDMLTAALTDLFEDREEILRRLNGMGVPKAVFSSEQVRRGGILARRMHVTVDGEEEEQDHPHDHDHHDHGHTPMSVIRERIDALFLEDHVRDAVRGVYLSIAEAESAVHGEPVTDIHFHELGHLDALADISAVALLMDMLRPDAVICSPVNVGSGTVLCAHGRLPVPAPATAQLLRGIPLCGSPVEGELCTPTGAALVRRYATGFGPIPQMRLSAVGYGAGGKDLGGGSFVRALLGTSEETPEDMWQLECNVDDMTGEEIGFAAERLRETGAREVFTVPVTMKKGRPGTLLRVFVAAGQKEDFVRRMFRLTSTLGIREMPVTGYRMDRSVRPVSFGEGSVRVKYADGFGVERSKPEYEDLAAVARSMDCSLREAAEYLRSAAEQETKQ